MRRGSVLVLCLVACVSGEIACAPGYTCAQLPGQSIVWVMKDEGNLYGPSCADMCSTAMCGTGSFYGCDATTPIISNTTSFAPIASALGFTCKKGSCWNSEAPGTGLLLVTRSGTERECYFPTETAFNCSTSPRNANCFGTRFAQVCPCIPRALDQACPWSSPPNNVPLATWPTASQANGMTCLERINYWRKKACEDGWVECPPCGLPPMVECLSCHACANSQAQYDQENGAHASFKRCGDMVQGEGGGPNCGTVIDAFVSERAPDSEGVMRCQGHCGPIVAAGCQTFFWGRSNNSNFYTLNWRTCNTQTCDTYCENPTKGECFLHDMSPSPPDNNGDSPATPGPGRPEETNAGRASAPSGFHIIIVSVAFLAWWRE